MSFIKQKIWAGFFAPLFVLGLVFQLAGCGDNEPQQRKAFSEFLQTQVIDSAKIHLPALTDEQKKSFGNYTADYDLLTGFTDQLNAAFSKSMASSMNELKTLNSLNAMVENRSKIETAQAEIQTVQAKLDGVIKSTGEKYAALKMPEDLKTVYGQAYAKVVTQQGDLSKQTLTLLDSTFSSILKVSDFLTQQKEHIQFNGQTLQFKDQNVLNQFNEINRDLQKNQQELMAVARKIAQLM
ncbi:MAG: DUF3053 domain-containing protein [Enterobacteriaceae bacterium]|jgi:uncharacterized lipoprotein YehR (DUF1307 family)|nr:DUF3053 domain-containing protein [Enterobacteriaceae bacterium]